MATNKKDGVLPLVQSSLRQNTVKIQLWSRIMSKKKYVVGKVGYCDNKDLGIKNRYGEYDGGHYVYIRSCKNEKCDVNVITSLEYENGKYRFDRLNKVKRGFLYPIPRSDGNFPQWSAVNLDGNIKNIPVERIKDIGKKRFRKRHKFFVGKFTKK